MVEPEVTAHYNTVARFFFLSLPGFAVAIERIWSKAVQLTGRPPLASSKAFPQAAGAQWNTFPLYTLYA